MSLPEDIVLPDISAEALTTKTVNGNGVFDQLMSAVNAQILEQHAADRITSDKYSDLYLGAIQAAMSQAMQFLLTKDKAAADAAMALASAKEAEQRIDLVKAQIKKTQEDTNLIELQQTLVPIQKEQLKQEVELTKQNILKVKKDIEATTAQITKITADTALVTAQTSEVAPNATSQRALTDAQKLKVDQEVVNLTSSKTLVDAQKLKVDKEVLTEQIEKIQEEVDLLQSQDLKVASEINLLNQKVTTETAQTTDPTGGILKAQYDLYGEQKNGFIAKTKQGNVKAANDVFAIQKSNDPDATFSPLNLQAVLEAQLGSL